MIKTMHTLIALTLTLAMFANTAPVRADDLPPVIEFKQAGGFAGYVYEVQLWPDGTAVRGVSQRGGSMKMADSLAPATVQALIDGLLRGGFADLPDRFGPANACCDRFEYTITLRQDGSEKTVVVTEDADAPDWLWEQIKAFRALLPMGQA